MLSNQNTWFDASTPRVETRAGSAIEPARRMLAIDPQLFATHFDSRPFYITHELGSHPLLSLSSMAALSERLHPNLVEWKLGHVTANESRDEVNPTSRACHEAILRVAETPTWVLLRQIETDSTYRCLVDALLDEIKPLSESIRPGMRQRESFLFVSSSSAVTPYHFDPEHNFLLQIAGEKTVHMWDPQNRDVLPQPAIDNYYAGIASNRNQPYRDEFLSSAWILPLKSGQGLHFPLHAPHWVRTESGVSISLSITFRSRHSRSREALHTANGHVRRLHLLPPGPSASNVWSTTAHAIYFVHCAVRWSHKQNERALRLARRLLRVARVTCALDRNEKGTSASPMSLENRN